MLCAQHVSYQLPDEETRVRHLLNAMTSADPGLLSAVAFAKTSDEHQNDFEKTAACLLPCCPVAAKRAKATGNKRGHSDISALTADISAMDLKKRAGETGVELRWCKHDEWRKLTQAQRDELIKCSFFMTRNVKKLFSKFPLFSFAVPIASSCSSLKIK